MNDNSNIDDLFKQAADQYPLRTDNSDWDKVLAAMDDDDTSMILIPPFETGGRRNSRRLLWLLLLLPLGGLGYYTWHKGQARHQAGIARVKTIPGDKNATSTGNAGSGGSTGSGGKEEKTATVEKVAPDPKDLPDIDGNKEGQPETDKLSLNGSNRTSAHTGKRRAVKAGMHPSRKAKTMAPDQSGPSEISQPSNRMAEVNARVTGGTGQGQEGKKNLEMSRTGERARTGGDLSIRADINANPLPKGVSKPAAKAPHPKDAFFYTGVLAAPDMSFVKFQSIKGVGYTAGLLLGYSLNGKWAIETGVYFDRKKYFTGGEYFSKKNIPWLSNVKLLDVSGACEMLEIPLNVRYNLNKGKTGGWFLTGGMSTYLMFNESYATRYIYNSVIGQYEYKYSKPSQYFFSVLNLSAGYQRRLGKIGELRLEPYLRVPLSGMGTGELPIMSAGLNIGITRRIK